MNSQSHPLVSVITPVYNGEKYLAECIESVLAQTYENWEYIIINNCSTDRTLEIAQRYVQKDIHIRVLSNDELLPIMQNWNHALRQISAESKYCKVVHADDWLFPDCITQMVRVAEANPSVGIVGSYRLEGNHVRCDGLPYTRTVIPGHEVGRMNLLYGPYLFGSPTSLLIPSGLIRDRIRSRKTFYNEANLHADTEICYELLQNSDFGFVHQVLTYTRMHDESVTSFAKKFNTLLPGEILVLKKYGPIYLSNQEYKKRLKERLREYYIYLARNIFRRRGKDFWDYHKNMLKGLGYPFSRSKLIGALSLVITSRLLDVKANARSMIGFLKA